MVTRYANRSKGYIYETLDIICFSRDRTLLNWWFIDDLSVKLELNRGQKYFK